jgi:hypothetical protein
MKLLRGDRRWLIPAGAVVFALQTIAWPVSAGRDARIYLLYYAEWPSSHPVFPQLQLYVTPLAPISLAGVLDHAGPAALTVLLGALFVTGLVAVHHAAGIAGPVVARCVAVALLLHPGYAALFHQVSSDAVFAVTVALWAAVARHALASGGARAAAAAGVAVFVAYLARPQGVLLLGIALLLLVLPRSCRARERVLAAAACVAAAAVPLLAWAGWNDARLGTFALTRVSAAQLPLYRSLTLDRTVDPANGPATRRLLALMQSDLVVREPYRAYGVTAREALAAGSDRVWSDLVPLVDRRVGWDDDYRLLRDVGVEAVRAHPGTFARGVAGAVAQQLSGSYAVPAPVAAAGPAPRRGLLAARLPLEPGSGRPALTEGQPIPAANTGWMLSRKDRAITVDWSTLGRPTVRIADASLRRRYVALTADAERLLHELPPRTGSTHAASVLNRIGRVYPPPAVWLALGVVGLALTRRPPLFALGGLAAVGLALVCVTALAAPPYREYRLPFDPLFVAFGVAGSVAALARLRGRTAQ